MSHSKNKKKEYFGYLRFKDSKQVNIMSRHSTHHMIYDNLYSLSLSTPSSGFMLMKMADGAS